MSVPITYLDSSAIIKRYVRESGSDTVRDAFMRAYSGDEVLSFSVWNIGEVLGVLDRARRIGRLNSDKYSLVRNRFLREVKRMSKIGILLLVPLRRRILVDSWKIVEKHHIYVADALQIATARNIGADAFLTGDRRLHEVALSENLRSSLLA